ncbi:chromosome segregation protein Pcs1 [Schizosaccharomyces japonicus yFS275]|uniref:Chromosome segregation protein Pcs1 n=1 Tax=Schizosaccharomyces japonicus (strain yFS275 / FY16936) TaxID=402676 RepID=B6JV07_SCHJY|nr:chromosome segregation protein Pcs1 [Schizosaccharomyces japonicus yFS275]EEB05208.2 chromosome segregation protein Pcs1 [Schizosaccharomyces japonicus yFS275]
MNTNSSPKGAVNKPPRKSGRRSSTRSRTPSEGDESFDHFVDRASMDSENSSQFLQVEIPSRKNRRKTSLRDRLEAADLSQNSILSQNGASIPREALDVDQAMTRLDSYIHQLEELQSTDAEDIFTEYQIKMGKALTDAEKRIQELETELKKSTEKCSRLEQQTVQLSSSASTLDRSHALIKELFDFEVKGSQETKQGILYDCVQNGRKGSIKFELLLGDENFTYMPKLDSSMNEELRNSLPDYLQEEIMFTKSQGRMFASRLMMAVQDK